MKKTRDGHNWFFVDESGDPTFYDRKGNLIAGRSGCSPILILGFAETTDPGSLRQPLLELQQQIANDSCFRGIPSLQKTLSAFHAKNDLPEIRYEVFKRLSLMDFRAHFVVARKKESIFKNRHGSDEAVFYDSLVSQLFQNVLHRFSKNTIIFSKRGSRTRQAPLQQAILEGIRRFENSWETSVDTSISIQAQTPKGEPCLSIVDYMNWAVYRAFTRGEMRFYDTISSKVSILVDIYDTPNYPKNWYNKRNPFHTDKTTPL